MAHIIERSLFNLCIAFGATIGLYSGDKLKLMEDF